MKRSGLDPSRCKWEADSGAPAESRAAPGEPVVGTSGRRDRRSLCGLSGWTRRSGVTATPPRPQSSLHPGSPAPASMDLQSRPVLQRPVALEARNRWPPKALLAAGQVPRRHTRQPWSQLGVSPPVPGGGVRRAVRRARGRSLDRSHDGRQRPATEALHRDSPVQATLESVDDWPMATVTPRHSGASPSR